MSSVKMKLLSEDAIMPKKAYPGDAGFDVFLPRHTRVDPGRHKIPLDFALEMPEWFQALIEPKSGNSADGIKGYLYLVYDSPNRNFDHGTPKCFDMDVIVGKVDSNYRGSVHVIIRSYEDRPFYLERGTKIAQMTFYHLPHVDGFEIVDELSKTERGEKRFGSSGTNIMNSHKN